MRTLLAAEGVRKYFPVYRGIFHRVRGWVRAVDGVSLSIGEGEVLALVGESGSGKTTLGRIVAGLLRPDAGRVLFDGVDLYSGRRLDKMVRHSIQVVFQNPDSSLNPRMTVAEILLEAVYERRREVGRDEALAEVVDLLGRVGLSPDHAYKYPHELSGGEKQRVAIARAIAMNPRLIVADEPVSALDVSVRAQILNLLMDIREEMGLSMLLISHDLGAVWSISDRVAVMYLGKVVEEAPTEELFTNPAHPYTRALLASAPLLPREVRRLGIRPRGEPPSPISPPPGCRFHTRCPFAKPECRTREPEMLQVAEGHRAACLLLERR